MKINIYHISSLGWWVLSGLQLLAENAKWKWLRLKTRYVRKFLYGINFKTTFISVYNHIYNVFSTSKRSSSTVWDIIVIIIIIIATIIMVILIVKEEIYHYGPNEILIHPRRHRFIHLNIFRPSGNPVKHLGNILPLPQCHHYSSSLLFVICHSFPLGCYFF